MTKQIIKSFNKKKLVGFYDNVYRKGEKKHWTKLLFNKSELPEEEREILKEISWRGKRILEAGSGTGQLAFLIAKRGGIITGIDFSPEAIKTASYHKHKNLKFICQDLNEARGNYDVIISAGTIEHTKDPFQTLKILKSKLAKDGQMIITCPNWLNTGGYILLTLKYLFDAPITLADIHFLTPLHFQRWAKQLKMRLTWRTFDHSWASGERLIADFQRRLPNVFKDMKMKKEKQIKDFIGWLENYAVKFDHRKDFSGATGLYHFKQP